MTGGPWNNLELAGLSAFVTIEKLQGELADAARWREQDAIRIATLQARLAEVEAEITCSGSHYGHGAGCPSGRHHHHDQGCAKGVLTAENEALRARLTEIEAGIAADIELSRKLRDRAETYGLSQWFTGRIEGLQIAAQIMRATP